MPDTASRPAGLVAVSALFVTVACAPAIQTLEGPGPSRTGTSNLSIGTTLESHDEILTAVILRARLARTPDHLAAVAFRYYQLGIRDLAMDYFHQSLAVSPRYATAFDGQARIWRDWGVFDRAVADAQRAVYFAPTSPAAWNTHGTVLQSLGLLDDAESSYRRALAVAPTAAYARTNLCYLALVRGRSADAEKECALAVAADPASKPARNNLGLLHGASGDRRRAFQLFASASGEAIAHYNMGLLDLAAGEYGMAATSFEAAYRLDPGFDQAHARARDARRRVLARAAVPSR